MPVDEKPYKKPSCFRRIIGHGKLMNAVFSARSGSGVFTGFRILEIPVMLRTLPVFLEHAHLRVIQFRGWLWSADQPPVVSGSLGWWPKSDDQGKDVVVIGIFVACRKGHKNRRNLYTSFFFLILQEVQLLLRVLAQARLLN